ncbi:unnamed protein product [Brassica rapa subsp. trilocularis]
MSSTLDQRSSERLETFGPHTRNIGSPLKKTAYNKNRILSEVTKVLNPVHLIHRCLRIYAEGEVNTPTEKMEKDLLISLSQIPA